MTKTAKVRQAFISGEVLTIRSIARRWDINCPYGTIRDIRNGGIDIADRQAVGKNGVKYKEYYLQN